MILLIIGLFVIAFVGYLLTITDIDALAFTGIVLIVIGCAIGVFSPFIWWSSYHDEVVNIRKYYAVRDTIATARSSQISDVERAALVNNLIDVNSWLAKAQYDNSTFFGDDLTPDEVDQLQPLK